MGSAFHVASRPKRHSLPTTEPLHASRSVFLRKLQNPPHSSGSPPCVPFIFALPASPPASIISNLFRHTFFTAPSIAVRSVLHLHSFTVRSRSGVISAHYSRFLVLELGSSDLVCASHIACGWRCSEASVCLQVWTTYFCCHFGVGSFLKSSS